MIYSGYSTCAVMMQYGNADVMLDIIRGIDTIRTGACALLWGLHKSGHFHVLMLYIEMGSLGLSFIHDIYVKFEIKIMKIKEIKAKIYK